MSEKTLYTAPFTFLQDEGWMSDFAGHWQIGGARGLSIHVTERPRWLTRQLCRMLFQMVWIDSKKAVAA